MSQRSNAYQQLHQKPDEALQTYNTRYASFFNLAYPELEWDNPLSRMHCIHYASSLYSKLRDKMTGRFNQDLPKNLQTAFKKVTNFEPWIITKQSINNRKVHKVNHIDITQGEDEVEINEAHVRNLNYKGKNYDPNYQQNKTKMNTNMLTNTTSSHHNARNQGYRYNKNNQQDKPVNVCITLHGPVSKEQLYKIQEVLRHPSQYRDRIKPEDCPAKGEYANAFNKFHSLTSRGHRYALTAVCMLTGFTWCVPLKTKTAEEVSKAYMDHIYSNFGGSIKILMDNGMEFKNKLFKEVVEKLGTEFSIHSPPYRPQSNGKIEGLHRFLKTCISKHINYRLEWDELTPMAMACYNFFPNCNARESAFFIMFGRDGRFSKKCIPGGYIPDFDWTTIYQDQDQPIKPIKQQDPTEDTTTPAAPTEVEGPPSSRLRSKMKQQLTSNEQGSPEHNPTPVDLPECNPAKIQVNTVEIAPKHYSLMKWTKLLCTQRESPNTQPQWLQDALWQ